MRIFCFLKTMGLDNLLPIVPQWKRILFCLTIPWSMATSSVQSLYKTFTTRLAKIAEKTLQKMNQRTFANFFILSISIVEPSVPVENNLNSSARKSEHDTGLPAKWNRTMVWKTSLIHLKTYLHQIIIVKLNPDMISSGGSGKGPGRGRGGASLPYS